METPPPLVQDISSAPTLPPNLTNSPPTQVPTPITNSPSNPNSMPNSPTMNSLNSRVVVVGAPPNASPIGGHTPRISGSPPNSGSNTPDNRRKRKQVKKACTNCRKAHAACDSLRPCKRCKKYSLEATCVDHQRKKRKYKTQDTRRRTGQGVAGELFATGPPTLVDGVNGFWTGSPTYTPTTPVIPDPANFTSITLNGNEAIVVSRTEFQQMQNVMKEVLLEVQHLKANLRQEQVKSTNLETQLNQLQQTYINQSPTQLPTPQLRPPPDLAKAVWRVSDRALIEYNERFAQLMHYTTEQLKGFHCLDLFPRAYFAYANECYARMVKLMDEGEDAALNTAMVFQTGRNEEITVDVTCQVQYDNGVARYYVMSIVEQNLDPVAKQTILQTNQVPVQVMDQKTNPNRLPTDQK